MQAIESGPESPQYEIHFWEMGDIGLMDVSPAPSMDELALKPDESPDNPRGTRPYHPFMLSTVNDEKHYDQKIANENAVNEWPGGCIVTVGQRSTLLGFWLTDLLDIEGASLKLVAANLAQHLGGTALPKE